MCSKSDLTVGFILKNTENGGFRYFYAHENNTLLERSKLVCTHNDLSKMKTFLNKTDVIESFTQEKMNTKWRFYKLTILTVFAALLKDVPMGCNDAVLLEPLLKNISTNCLTFKEITRQLVPFSCACSPSECHSTTGRRNFGNIIRDLVRRSWQKYNNTVTLTLLRYKNLICYVSNINAVFQVFR